MSDLTLQAFLDAAWRDIAQLEFPEPARGADGRCYFTYDDDHLIHLGSENPLTAASLNLPVSWGPSILARWPRFLDDLRPLGSARAWWLRRLNLPGNAADDFRLLRECVIAPIGHLRIKEAVPPKDGTRRRFPKQAVIDREYAFLELAASMGAQVGGATGAGGESPKLLVRVDANHQVWIDSWQDEPANGDRAYLVKFARGAKTARDRVILKAEYTYYRALAALGVDTVATDGLEFHEGANGPSLWLPRFDVAPPRRRGVESIPLLDAAPGAWLTHEDVLVALRRVFGPKFRDALLEYLRRELLNVVFGNSDNHGRNFSLLKTEAGVALAPVYDFAPMVMDPEGVIRTTKWRDHERGEVDWRSLLASFGSDEAWLRRGLAELSERLRTLPRLLGELGLPDEVMTFPPLGLADTERKLQTWSLL